MAVQTKCSEVSAKNDEGQYSPVRHQQARLVSSLLYGTQAMFVLNVPAFGNKNYSTYVCFHRNSPYGEILTNKEPIRTLGFSLKTTLPYDNKLILTEQVFGMGAS